LTKGGLYGHFQSKEAIWYAVYEEAVEIWKSIVFKDLRDISDPLKLKEGLNLQEIANFMSIAMDGAATLYSATKEPTIWKQTITQLHRGDTRQIHMYLESIERCRELIRLAEMFGNNMGGPEQVLEFIGKLSEQNKKPIALSFFSERRYIEEFKRINGFSVFNDAVESVRAMRMLRDYSQGRNHTRPA